MWFWLLLTFFISPVFNQQHGDVRLAGYGASLISGRLEIYFGNEWGTICGDVKFNTVTASVACFQLGFGPAISVTYYPDLRFGIGDGKIQIGEVVCTGEESHILRCSYKLADQLPRCAHHLDVGVICSPSSLPYSGAVRLNSSRYSLNPVYPSKGVLELFLYGEWKTVCGVNFDKLVVDSVCRHLGYTHSVSFTESSLNDSMWNVSTLCLANSTCFNTCNTTVLNETQSCSPVNVECGFNLTQVDVSLSGNRIACEMRTLAPYSGQVMITGYQNAVKIFFGDNWRMVCFDDLFSYANADVLCKQFGYSYAVRYDMVESVMTDGVFISCSGFENSVLMCPLLNLTQCSKFVLLKCNNEDPSYGSVKLVNGAGSAGTLSIFDGNRFNPVCDSQFGTNELEVACRQLGYNGGIQIIKNSLFEDIDTSLLYQYKFTCTGQEDYLLQCKTDLHGGSSFCRFPYDAVAVQCSTSQSTTVRINGNDGFGRLEVKLDMKWGTVCGNEFDELSAHVACRQLGYKTSVAFFNGNDEYDLSLPILLTSVQCSGFEADLFSCPHTVANNDTCQHEHDVFVNCSKDYPIQDGSLRIVPTEEKSWSGRLEISYHGLWMSVCGKFFSQISANVACHQLGYSSVESYCSQYCNVSGHGLVFFAEFHCFGNESRLVECEKDIHNDDFCGHDFDVKVICKRETTVAVTSTFTEPQNTAVIPTNNFNASLKFIIFGSAGGLVFCILLFVSIVLICCCCLFHKKERAPVSHSTTNVQAVFNVYDTPDCYTREDITMTEDITKKHLPINCLSEEVPGPPEPVYDEINVGNLFMGAPAKKSS